jgi:hypothetical protein
MAMQRNRRSSTLKMAAAVTPATLAPSNKLQLGRILSRYSDSLGAGRSGDRILVGARFSAPVQTGPGAHSAYYAMSTGSFPGVKRQGRGVDHPPSSSAEVKERLKLHLYYPSGHSWPPLGWTSSFNNLHVVRSCHWHPYQPQISY